MKILLACLLLAATCACERSHAGTPLNLQVCTTTPGSGGLVGCPLANVSFAPVSAASRVRSQVNAVQGWRAFSSLTASDAVYAQDGAWHTLSTITPALTSIPPVSTPPACAPTPDVYVPMNWTCAVANGVATCTAPVKP